MKKSVSPFESNNRSVSFAILVFGITVLIAVFFGISVYLKEQNIRALEEQTTTFTAQTDSLLSQSLREIERSQRVVSEVSQKRLLWSEILRDLFATLPQGIGITSLNADGNGRLSASLVADDFQKVSRTVELLSVSQRFKDTFIPSLSAGASVDQTSLKVNFPLVIEIGKQNQNANNSNQNAS